MTRLATLVRFGAIVCSALILGLAFAHVMELPGKLRLEGPAWLIVQQNLYIAFGPFAAILEPLSILLAWWLVLLLRGRPGHGLAMFAAISASAGLAAWASIVSPANARLQGWTTTTMPTDWAATRTRWELGHAIHAAFFGAAFCALVIEAVQPRRPANADHNSDRQTPA